MTTFAIILLILLLLGVTWGGLHVLLRVSPPTTDIISHRGAKHLAPENSLASIRAAIACRAPYIEIDIQRSADGQLVLFHDAQLDRLTNGSGRLAAHSWEELKMLDAGSHFSIDYANERIPLLRDALKLIKNSPAQLVIEVKHPRKFPEIDHDLAEILHELTCEQEVVVISFDHAWLERFRQLAPTVRVAPIWIVPASFGSKPKNGIVNIFWLALIIDPTFGWRMRHRGNRVWVWMVNSWWLMRLVCWLGVDGFTTDYPDVGLRVCGRSE